MRIGPIIIERARSHRCAKPQSAVAYAPPMRSQHDFWATFPFPEGVRYIPARKPLRPIDPSVEAWLRENAQPPRTDDVEESIRRMREISGSISIGRPPRKADYRARWRYNGEEFDEA